MWWTWAALMKEFKRRLNRDLPELPESMDLMTWPEYLEYYRRRLRKETAGRWVLWHVALVKRGLFGLSVVVAIVTALLLWLHLRVLRLEASNEKHSTEHPSPTPDDPDPPITWGR